MVFPVQNQRTTIGAITLDALVTEQISLPSTVTAYPVEDGSVITDHVTQEQEELEITGVVTGSIVLASDPGGGRARLIDVRDALRKIHAQRQPIVIVTGIDVYQDMVVYRCEIGRNNESDQLDVSISAKKIKRVTTKTADIPPEKVAPKVKGKAGATKTPAGKARQEQMGPADQRGRLKKALDSVKSRMN